MVVKVSSGGQTFITGNFTFEIGKVYVVVATGFLDHVTKDFPMKTPAVVNPPITTATQNSLLRKVLVVEM